MSYSTFSTYNKSTSSKSTSAYTISPKDDPNLVYTVDTTCPYCGSKSLALTNDMGLTSSGCMNKECGKTFSGKVVYVPRKEYEQTIPKIFSFE